MAGHVCLPSTNTMCSEFSLLLLTILTACWQVYTVNKCKYKSVEWFVEVWKTKITTFWVNFVIFPGRDCWVIWAMDMVDTAQWMLMGSYGLTGLTPKGEKSWGSSNFMQTGQSFQPYLQPVHFHVSYSHPKYHPTSWGEFVLQFFQMVWNGCTEMNIASCWGYFQTSSAFLQPSVPLLTATW